MTEKIEQTITESPLFKHLDAETLAHLIEVAEIESHPSGAVLIEEGTRTEKLFIVLSGRVRVWTRGLERPVELKVLGSGAYFGEVGLLSGKEATATVEVKSTEAEVLTLPRTVVLELVEHDDKVKRILQGVTIARAKDTIEKVLK